MTWTETPYGLLSDDGRWAILPPAHAGARWALQDTHPAPFAALVHWEFASREECEVQANVNLNREHEISPGIHTVLSPRQIAVMEAQRDAAQEAMGAVPPS